MLITLLAIFILCFSLTTINASDNNINTVNMEDNNLNYENTLYHSSEIENNDNNILSNDNFPLKDENNENNKVNANPLLNEETSNVGTSSVDNSPKTPMNIPSQSTMDEDGKISTNIEGNDTNFNYKSGTHYKVRLLDKNQNLSLHFFLNYLLNYLYSFHYYTSNLLQECLQCLLIFYLFYLKQSYWQILFYDFDL